MYILRGSDALAEAEYGTPRRSNLQLGTKTVLSYIFQTVSYERDLKIRMSAAAKTTLWRDTLLQNGRSALGSSRPNFPRPARRKYRPNLVQSDISFVTT